MLAFIQRIMCFGHILYLIDFVFEVEEIKYSDVHGSSGTSASLKCQVCPLKPFNVEP